MAEPTWEETTDVEPKFDETSPVDSDDDSAASGLKGLAGLVAPALTPPAWKMALLKKLPRASVVALNDGLAGYLPNALSGAKQAGKAMLKYGPSPVGVAKDFSKADYVKDRDSLQNYLDQSGEGTKVVGHGLGLAGSVAAAGIGEAKALAEPVLKSFARTVGTGAAVGGAANPGNTPGEVSLQPVERAKNAGKGAALSAALALPGTAIRLLRERLATAPAKNADEVIAVANKMGIQEDQIPTEMLTTAPVAKDKAAALVRDPSVGGARVRKNLKPFHDKLQNTAEDFVSEAHPATESKGTVGTRVREQIPQEVEKRLAPARQAYEELAAPMEKATPETRAVKVGTGRLRNELASKDSTGELRTIVEREKQHFLENIHTVEDLKQYRTDIGKRAQDAYNQQNSRVGDLYSNLYKILTRERDRSLERSILNSGRKIGAQAKAQATVEKLRAADKLYGDTIRDTLDAVGAKSGRNQSPVASVVDHLESSSVDKLPDRLWAKMDSEQAASFQKTFPTQAEDIRKLKLQETARAASGREGVVSPTALENQLKGMTPETQSRLLGTKAAQLPDQRTLLKAIPDPNFNPSQTSIRSGALQSVFHPKKAIESVAGAAELNLRRPLPFVKQGRFEGAARNALGTAVVQQGIRNATPDNIIPKVMGTKYEGVFKSAQARGENGFAATYYMLSQSDPEFRSLVDGNSGQQ